MSFIFSELFFLLLLAPFYLLFFKAGKKEIYLLLSFTFIVTALSRPVYHKSDKNSNDNIEYIIALDISKSMLAKDIPPNRFEFAKKKVQELLEGASKEKITLLAYSNQSYLISPYTNNYETLKFFTQNLHLKDISQNGTDLLKLLKTSDRFFNPETKKILLLFSDGGEKKDLSREIKFAKKHKISIYLYNTATSKGSAIEYKKHLVKDKNGRIVISKKNEAVKELAIETNGIYQDYSLRNNDLERITGTIRKEFDKEQLLKSSEKKIELFYIFIILGFVFFLLARFDIKGSVK